MSPNKIFTIKFKTFFARPHFFRFEWTDRSVVTSEERLNVVWKDGKQTYGYYSWDDAGVEKKEDLSLGIAGATRISRGSAHVIPALLMEEVGGFRLTETSNLKASVRQLALSDSFLYLISRKELS